MKETTPPRSFISFGPITLTPDISEIPSSSCLVNSCSCSAEHEQELTKQLLDGISEISGVNVIGPKDMKDRGGVVSFTVDGVHPHDVGQHHVGERHLR